MATTGIRSLALMQGAWAKIVWHNPEIQHGDWVAYYNGESKKGDTLWPGRATTAKTKLPQTGMD
jgi:hypothetical protein